MSSAHARLVRRDGGWSLEDQESTNGTWLNGRQIKRAFVRPGDVVELGHTLFLFCEYPAGSPAGLLDDDSASSSDAPPGFFTLVPHLASELDRLKAIAASTVPVLLRGETGCGKEVLARSMHTLSGRPGPMVAVNCGAIPGNLVEAQLFGHVKGAFSGAVRDEPGFVRAAHHGTLFLDEIGDLPPASQAALLRVLQEHEVVPVGSSRTVSVDIRVISATHLPLEELIERGTFRRDLYARLAAFNHVIVPLRERREDIGALVAALLPRAAPGISSLHFRPDAVRAMLTYGWPLNVRELEQCLTTSAVLAKDHLITLDTLPDAIRAARNTAVDAPAAEGELAPEQARLREELVERLRETRGNVSVIARDMSKARQQVQRWLRRFGLDPDRYRT
jgi:transcriptional regulator with PAS, ATPase and Fis domain